MLGVLTLGAILVLLAGRALAAGGALDALRALGALGTLVGETTEIGENPYAMALTADGSRALIGNYSGEVTGTSTNSTLVVLDTDPESDTFMEPLTWLVNK